MAKKQSMQSGTPSTGTSTSTSTTTPDPTYNVISVLYHALKGASNCEQYIQDAQGGELQEFFQEAMEAQRDLAEKAKQLLGLEEERMTGGASDEQAQERPENPRH